MSEEPVNPDEIVAGADDDRAAEESVAAVRRHGSNDYFRSMMDRNFLEYASYVIKDRAIPDVDDGLKPVQRRVLWALYQVYDGRTHKVANIVGNTMHYHPHGNASIEDALVVLANKEYFITRQGNFGNILTGSPAAAGRYIECSLSPMGREVLFNNDITEFVDTYDGRNVEPVVLPVKVPSLLMLGSDGIAVGMATRIMPHNFRELLEAQIHVLRDEPFELYPDFQQGGLMDAREYADGNGKIVLRARIEVDGRRLVIREIPATTTTESLIASIEKAAEKNKIRISSVTDYTTEKVEIEIVPTRGYDPEKTLQALYMYTDCSVSISVNMTVIREGRPVSMTVSEVLRRNTAKLLEYLKRELEIDLARQEDLFHAKTLAQIFFENRIYKKIEECKSEAEEYAAVRTGLAPFRDQLRRDVTDPDIDKLLALPVRRISRFDIEKNRRELAEILDRMEEIRKHLGSLKKYAISYLKSLLDKYGANFPRRTEIEHFEKIDRREAALNNIKVGWDRKNGYVGTAVKSEDMLVCNEFDKFLCVEKNGRYKVIPLPPEKLFIGKLYDFRKLDENVLFGVIYREVKSGKYYGKRSSIGGFILEREYALCPAGCRLELFTPRSDAIYTLLETRSRGGDVSRELNLMDLPVRTPKARGILISSKPLTKITHLRYLEPEELAARIAPAVDEPEAEGVEEELSPVPEAVPETVPETGSADVSETPEKKAADVVPEVAVEPVSASVSETEPDAVPEVLEENAAAASESVPESTPEVAVEAMPESTPDAATSESVPESTPEVEELTLSADPAPKSRKSKSARGSRKSASRPTATEQREETAPGGISKAGGDTGNRAEAGSDSDSAAPAVDDVGDEFGIVQQEFGF